MKTIIFSLTTATIIAGAITETNVTVTELDRFTITQSLQTTILAKAITPPKDRNERDKIRREGV